MIYVDSNYWLDSRLPEHEYVRQVMRQSISEGIAINYVTLFEVAHYLRNLPRMEFESLVESIEGLSTLSII